MIILELDHFAKYKLQLLIDHFNSKQALKRLTLFTDINNYEITNHMHTLLQDLLLSIQKSYYKITAVYKKSNNLL